MQALVVLVISVLLSACGTASKSDNSSKTGSGTASQTATDTTSAATTTQTASETATETESATATETETADDESGDDTDGFTLAGVWKSECLSVSFGIWAVATLTNSDTDSTYDVVYYLTSSCVTPVRKQTALRTYDIVGDVDGIAGAKKVNFTYSTSSAVLLTDVAVSEANSSQLYGYSDWAKDGVKDITGKKQGPSSDPEPSDGTVTYIIVKIDGDTYRAGDPATGDGSTEENRPTSLGNVTLTKQ